MAIACMRCSLSITVFSSFCNTAFGLLSLTDIKKYTLIKDCEKGHFQVNEWGHLRKILIHTGDLRRADKVCLKERFLAKGQESLLTSVVWIMEKLPRFLYKLCRRVMRKKLHAVPCPTEMGEKLQWPGITWYKTSWKKLL